MPIKRSPSIRTAVRALVLACGGAMLTSSLASAVYAPPDGTVSVQGSFPNIEAPADAIDLSQVSVTPSSTLTSLILDRANHYLFELGPVRANSPLPCAGKQTILMRYSLSNPQDAKPGCFSEAITADGQEAGFPNSTTSWAVVASKAHLILVPDSTFTNAANISRIDAISEDSLTVVGEMCAGSVSIPGVCDAAPPEVGVAASQVSPPFLWGLSYDPVSNRILTLTTVNDTFFAAASPTGVTVSAYDIGGSNAQPNFKEAWSIQMPPSLCQEPMYLPADDTQWGIAAPQISVSSDHPALFVPCGSGLDSGEVPTGAAVVKVALQPGCRCPATSPAEWATQAPGPASGFLFDPAGARGYLLPETGQNVFGATVLVYDGSGPGAGAMAGRFDIETHEETNILGALMFAVDPDTGRFYAENPLEGLRVVDGRRTPPAVYDPFDIRAAVRSTAGRPNLVVAPPEADQPYPRLIAPLVTNLAQNTSKQTFAQVKSFTVIADRLDVSQQPPATAVDNSTYSNPIPPGATSSMSYAVHSAGYGVHSDLVGGYAGAWYNNNPRASDFGALRFPSGSSTLDLVFGSVEAAKLNDGASQGAASAFADANGNATSIYRACTDEYSPQSCDPPQCDVSSAFSGFEIPSQIQPYTDPCGVAYGQYVELERQHGHWPPTTSTAQEWPYPSAQCSQPGSGAPTQEYDGAYWTQQHAAGSDTNSVARQDLFEGLEGQALGTSVPLTSGQATGARAFVACSGARIHATGRYACTSLMAAAALPAGPSTSSEPSSPCEQTGQMLTLSQAETTTDNSPPGSNGGLAVSTVTARAAGIHLILSDGAAIDIGEIDHTAKAWAGGQTATAGTKRTLSIHDVRLTPPGGEAVVLCQGQESCADGGQLEALLDQLNSLDPTHIYATVPTPDEPFGVDSDGTSPKGSPGGYLGQVQASVIEQQGDVQFNNMTGFEGTEKTLLPALRIVVFDPGDAQINREVLDLAGVEADARLGIDVELPFSDVTNPPAIDIQQAEAAAGLVSGAPFATGNGGGGGVPVGPQPRHKGLLALWDRTLDGLGWLVRSPFGAIQMAAFLTLLGIPVALMRRRWAGRLPGGGTIQ